MGQLTFIDSSVALRMTKSCVIVILNEMKNLVN
jgi:hypothetical protein